MKLAKVFAGAVTSVLLAVGSLAYSQTQIQTCLATNGGYTTRGIDLKQLDEETLEIVFQKFSPVPDIVPDYGIKIGNTVIKKLSVKVNAGNCRVARSRLDAVQLFDCYTAHPTRAQAELLNGEVKEFTLPHSTWFKTKLNIEENISETSNTLVAVLYFPGDGGTQEIGVPTYLCR